MTVHRIPVDFPITDAPTLQFVDHCMQNWNDFALCSDAHVAYMKHLTCLIFNLPIDSQLIGILFEVCVCAAMSLMAATENPVARTRRSC